jgi:hypothetical protein
MSEAKTQGGNKMQEIYGLPPKVWEKLTYHAKVRHAAEFNAKVIFEAYAVSREMFPLLGGLGSADGE